MFTMAKRTVELDLRGQVCPASLLLSLKKMNSLREDLSSGSVALRVLTENRESVPTISAAAGSMGYVVTVDREEGHYVLLMEAVGAEKKR